MEVALIELYWKLQMNNFAAGGTAFLLEDPDATDFSDANAIMESPSYRNSKAQWSIFEFGGLFFVTMSLG